MNRSAVRAIHGDVSLGALNFSLPFKVRESKLNKLSGQDLVKYGHLASNRIYDDWKHMFGKLRISAGDLKDTLRRFDLESYGTVDANAFTSALKRAGVPLGNTRMLALFNDFDVRANNRVDIEMFTCVVGHWITVERNAAVHANQRSARRRPSPQRPQQHPPRSRVMDRHVRAILNNLALNRSSFTRICDRILGAHAAPAPSGATAKGSATQSLSEDELWLVMTEVTGVKPSAVLRGALRQCLVMDYQRCVLDARPGALRVDPYVFVSALAQGGGGAGGGEDKSVQVLRAVAEVWHMARRYLYLMQSKTGGGRGGAVATGMVSMHDFGVSLTKSGMPLGAEDLSTAWEHLSLLHRQRSEGAESRRSLTLAQIDETLSGMGYHPTDSATSASHNDPTTPSTRNRAANGNDNAAFRLRHAVDAIPAGTPQDVVHRSQIGHPNTYHLRTHIAPRDEAAPFATGDAPRSPHGCPQAPPPPSLRTPWAPHTATTADLEAGAVVAVPPRPQPPKLGTSLRDMMAAAPPAPPPSSQQAHTSNEMRQHTRTAHALPVDPAGEETPMRSLRRTVEGAPSSTVGGTIFHDASLPHGSGMDLRRASEPQLLRRLRAAVSVPQSRSTFDRVFQETRQRNPGLSRGEVQQKLAQCGIMCVGISVLEEFFYWCEQRYTLLSTFAMRHMLGLPTSAIAQSMHEKAVSSFLNPTDNEIATQPSQASGGKGAADGVTPVVADVPADPLLEEDFGYLTVEERRACNLVCVRANAIIRVCEAKDALGEGCVTWGVFQQAMEDAGITLDAEERAAVKAAVVDGQDHFGQFELGTGTGTGSDDMLLVKYPRVVTLLRKLLADDQAGRLNPTRAHAHLHQRQREYLQAHAEHHPSNGTERSNFRDGSAVGLPSDDTRAEPTQAHRLGGGGNVDRARKLLVEDDAFDTPPPVPFRGEGRGEEQQEQAGTTEMGTGAAANTRIRVPNTTSEGLRHAMDHTWTDDQEVVERVEQDLLEQRVRGHLGGGVREVNNSKNVLTALEYLTEDPEEAARRTAFDPEVEARRSEHRSHTWRCEALHTLTQNRITLAELFRSHDASNKGCLTHNQLCGVLEHPKLGLGNPRAGDEHRDFLSQLALECMQGGEVIDFNEFMAHVSTQANKAVAQLEQSLHSTVAHNTSISTFLPSPPARQAPPAASRTDRRHPSNDDDDDDDDDDDGGRYILHEDSAESDLVEASVALKVQGTVLDIRGGSGGDGDDADAAVSSMGMVLKRVISRFSVDSSAQEAEEGLFRAADLRRVFSSFNVNLSDQEASHIQHSCSVARQLKSSMAGSPLEFAPAGGSGHVHMPATQAEPVVYVEDLITYLYQLP